MRTLRQIKIEIAEAEAVVANADRIAPAYDNDGNEVCTAAEVVASYRQRLARLTEQKRRFIEQITGAVEAQDECRTS